MIEHIEEKPNLPLVLHGESGSGKTSLMAKCSFQVTSQVKFRNFNYFDKIILFRYGNIFGQN